MIHYLGARLAQGLLVVLGVSAISFGMLFLAGDPTAAFAQPDWTQEQVAAFRRDTEDPEIVRQFAALVGVEERLKMLCLLTLADVEAVSRETLTSWREELLWRLYVDTYNHLTQRYGDELIERNQAGLDEVLQQRPEDLSTAEITKPFSGIDTFLERD